MKQPLTVAELTGADTSKPLSEAQWEIVRQYVRSISRDPEDWGSKYALAFIDLQMEDLKMKIAFLDVYLKRLWKSYIMTACTLVRQNNEGAYFRLPDDFILDDVDCQTSELFPLSTYLRECLAKNLLNEADCRLIMNRQLHVNFSKPEDPVRQTLTLIINIGNMSMEERLAHMEDVLDENQYFFYPFNDDVKLEQCLNDITNNDLKLLIDFNSIHLN